MYVDVYNSNNHKLKFLVVPTGTDVSGDNLGLTDTGFSQIALFKSNVLLEPGLIGIDDVKAKSDIQSSGYHICGVKIDIQVGKPNS